MLNSLVLLIIMELNNMVLYGKQCGFLKTLKVSVWSARKIFYHSNLPVPFFLVLFTQAGLETLLSTLFLRKHEL